MFINQFLRMQNKNIKELVVNNNDACMLVFRLVFVVVHVLRFTARPLRHCLVMFLFLNIIVLRNTSL